MIFALTAACFGSYVYIGVSDCGCIKLPGIDQQEITHIKSFMRGERTPDYVEESHALYGADSIFDIISLALQEIDNADFQSLDGYMFADRGEVLDFICHASSCAERAEAYKREYQLERSKPGYVDPFGD